MNDKIFTSNVSIHHFVLQKLHYFRYEGESSMSIKGKKFGNKDSWPTILLPDTPAYEADILIQLVEKNTEAGRMPRPSPNGLYLKATKDVHQQSGVTIVSDGNTNPDLKGG